MGYLRGLAQTVTRAGYAMTVTRAGHMALWHGRVGHMALWHGRVGHITVRCGAGYILLPRGVLTLYPCTGLYCLYRTYARHAHQQAMLVQVGATLSLVEWPPGLAGVPRGTLARGPRA